MLASGPSQSRHPQSQQTASKWINEAYFPGDTKFSFSSYTTRSEEEISPTCQTQLDEGTNYTQASMKRRRDRRSHFLEVMRA